MAADDFNFEAEFALLDVGATSSLVRSGAVRPSVLAFTRDGGLEAVALYWDDDRQPDEAFEEARRYIRDLAPVAYAVISRVSVNAAGISFDLPLDAMHTAAEHLAICLVSKEGEARAVLYPIRRQGGAVSTGKPVVSEADVVDWCPIGEIWQNPFCTGDLVQFRTRDRVVEPGSPLWQSVVELTRLRINEDQENADEYMGFLDDLRNGIFTVVGRPDRYAEEVLLRPRTRFNPLGTLRVAADRLMLMEGATPDVQKVAVS